MDGSRRAASLSRYGPPVPSATAFTETEPRARRTSPRRAAALSAVALSTVAACGGGHGAPPAELAALRPAVIVASAAATTAADSQPVLDEVSDVVREYYGALDRLRSGTGTRRLARLVARDCPCRAQLRAVRAAARRGERYTDRVRVRTLVAHVDGADLADVVVSLDVDSGGLVDAAGHRIGTASSLRGVHRELMLRRIDGRWLVEQVIAV